MDIAVKVGLLLNDIPKKDNPKNKAGKKSENSTEIVLSSHLRKKIRFCFALMTTVIGF